jgi:hypothetical protein
VPVEGFFPDWMNGNLAAISPFSADESGNLEIAALNTTEGLLANVTQAGRAAGPCAVFCGMGKDLRSYRRQDPVARPVLKITQCVLIRCENSLLYLILLGFPGWRLAPF